MADELSLNRDAAIRDFRAVLAKNTKKAACGRRYVLVSKLRLWLKSKVTPGVDNRTQASRLLAYAYRSRTKPDLPITVEQLSDNQDGCLLVFCILLELGWGALIHEFFRRDKVDKHLPIPLLSLNEMVATMHTSNLNTLAEEFNELQWQFCPATFEMNMGRDFHENRILPFCKREQINEKGATAQLWQIEVPEEFVGPKLRAVRAVVKDAKYDDPNDDIGPRYHFALKSFEEGKMRFFINERDAFRALRDQAGMVQYLGEYVHVEVKKSSTNPHNSTPGEAKLTSNIILEYGDHDLDEYFAELAPPVLQSEIESFWKGLFEVAHAVKGIHHLEVNTDGRVREFYGWHADIKPDNILIVQGQFKLADPGFAKFVKKTDTDPVEVLAGGTETYGAPERHPSRRGRLSAVPQTIDTWSLGCVFSIAATWVVLGYEGIRRYTELRHRAINKIVEEQRAQATSSKSRPTLTPGDYFHNGEQVLADVLSWHEYLRSTSRRTDMVTSRVLDLVDEKIFKGDAALRIKAEGLCKELEQIKAQIQPEKLKPPKSIMEFLLAVEEAPSRPVEANITQAVTKSKQSLTIVDERQARKTAHLETPLKMTAQRSEYLKSELSSPDDSTQRDEEMILRDPPLGISSSRTPVAQNANADLSRSHQGRPPIHTEISAGEATETTPIRQYPSDSSTATRSRLARQKRRTNPPQDVFQAREEIETRPKIHVPQIFGGRPVKDGLLSRHFSNRDIKFLVDNAESMSPHWYKAMYVLETLLLKAAGQDENGMDLSFTSGNISVQGRKDESRFMKAMRDPEARPRERIRTDMKKPLGEILDDYLREAGKRKKFMQKGKNLTLIVLTDGIWDGMQDKGGVNDKIITFAKELKSVVGNLKDRPVSIEFIQFGDDPDATYRLWKLDNDLEYAGIPDIIDTEHCSGDVNKMLLGSFVEEYDKYDDDDQTLSPTLEQDVVYRIDSPSRSSTFQPIAASDSVPRSSNHVVGGPFELPARVSTGSTLGSPLIAGVQQQPSTKPSRHSHHPR